MTASKRMVQQTIRTGRAALCAVQDSMIVVESSETGIRALLDIAGQKSSGMYALDWGDKLVGRAAGLLLLLVHPRSVFAGVMSAGARDLLKQAEIPCSYDALVPAILNRTASGPCPMEEAVGGIDDPQLALSLLQKKLFFCSTNPSRKENP